MCSFRTWKRTCPTHCDIEEGTFSRATMDCKSNYICVFVNIQPPSECVVACVNIGTNSCFILMKYYSAYLTKIPVPFDVASRQFERSPRSVMEGIQTSSSSVRDTRFSQKQHLSSRERRVQSAHHSFRNRSSTWVLAIEVTPFDPFSFPSIRSAFHAARTDVLAALAPAGIHI